MVQRSPANPAEPTLDDPFTFTDVTVLTFLAVSAVTLTILLLLGALSAEHRIVAVLTRALGLS